jgi:nucleoside-diphosphate-sugar epimerase
MTTLIIGAGLIGASLVPFARARGESVVLADAAPLGDFLARRLGPPALDFVRLDVRDAAAVEAVMREHRPEAVVHTAGLIGHKVQASLSNSIATNVLGSAHVAEAAARTGVRRLVLLSSSGVYDRRLAAGAAAIDETAARGSSGPYANLTLAKEAALEAYASVGAFELVVLRPASVFGLGHFGGGSAGGRRVQRLLLAGLRGEEIVLPAAEAVSNEYVYAKDVGLAIDRALTGPAPGGRAFNIGNGYVTSLERLLADLATVTPALRVTVGAGERPDGRVQPMSIARAAAGLGWAPRFTLPAAFADYAADVAAFGGGEALEKALAQLPAPP